MILASGTGTHSAGVARRRPAGHDRRRRHRRAGVPGDGAGRGPDHSHLRRRAGRLRRPGRLERHPGRRDRRLSTPIWSCWPGSCASSGRLSSHRFRIVNTHPALLPAFPGAHAIRDALAAGVPTHRRHHPLGRRGRRHRPVIAQAPVPIEPGDDEDSLRARIQAVEKPLFVDTIAQLCKEFSCDQDRRSPRAHQRLRQDRVGRAGAGPARGRGRDRLDRIDRRDDPRRSACR